MPFHHFYGKLRTHRILQDFETKKLRTFEGFTQIYSSYKKTCIISRLQCVTEHQHFSSIVLLKPNLYTALVCWHDRECCFFTKKKGSFQLNVQIYSLSPVYSGNIIELVVVSEG